jgi:hypothetical protein
MFHVIFCFLIRSVFCQDFVTAILCYLCTYMPLWLHGILSNKTYCLMRTNHEGGSWAPVLFHSFHSSGLHFPARWRFDMPIVSSSVNFTSRLLQFGQLVHWICSCRFYFRPFCCCVRWWYTWWLCFFIETSGIYTSVNTQATQPIDSPIAISTQLCIIGLYFVLSLRAVIVSLLLCSINFF